jgi:hypothetical protein
MTADPTADASLRERVAQALDAVAQRRGIGRLGAPVRGLMADAALLEPTN